MNRIKEYRKKAGYTQAELGDRLFVNQTAISQWERGVTSPSHATLVKLAEVLDTTPSVLMGWDDAPSVQPQEAASNDDLKDVEFALFHGFTKEEQDRLKEFDEDTLQDVRNFIRFTMEMKKKKDPKKNKE